jgi:hypothetical protein
MIEERGVTEAGEKGHYAGDGQVSPTAERLASDKWATVLTVYRPASPGDRLR